MSVLEYRMQYLAVADLDYLSARLLLFSALPSSGLPKAAEAIEKLLKLWLMLEAKINRKEELGAKDLKRFNHDLPALFRHLRQSVSADFDTSWDSYLLELQDAYSRRYPDQWLVKMTWVIDLDRLDQAYSYLRKGVVENFPEEEVQQARKFGGSLLAAYDGVISDSISKKGGMPPLRILEVENKCLNQFVIE